MTTYNFPNTYAEEPRSAEGPIRAAVTGIGGFQAITQKGPPGIPIRCRTFDEWKRVFGERESRGNAAYEAKQAFDEGLKELITVRQAHYTDITDKDTYVGGIASRMLQSVTAVATAAEKITGSAPFVLSAGDIVSIDVDNVGAADATFDAAAGYVIDTTTYPLGGSQAGLDFTVAFDGGEVQTVTFVGAITALADIVAEINAQIYGGKAEEDGGQLKLSSDTQGTGSSVVATAGTSGLVFGGSPVAGTGDVVDIKAVTIAELESVVEADTTALVTDNGDGTATISSPTTGSSSELDFQASTGLDAFGLSVEVILGTDAGGVANTLKVEAGYMGYTSPGEAGNLLAVKSVQNPFRVSLGVGNDLLADATAGDTEIQLATISGVAENSVLKIWDGSNSEAAVVTGVRSVVSGGSVLFYAQLSAGLTNSFTAATTRVQSEEFDLYVYEDEVQVELWSGLSMYDVADNFVETKLNDEYLGSKYVYVTDQDAGVGADLPSTDADAVALTGGTSEITGLVATDWIGDQDAKTGLYAWDEVDEFMAITTLDTNAAAVVHAGSVYAESRLWVTFITYVDEAMSYQDAVSYRQNILGLNSSYVALYAGGCKVQDPIGSGSNPQKSLAGMGYIMGKMAVTDGLSAPNGGPWQTPAGEGEYGESRVALDVATVYTDRESGFMNEAGINVIRKFGRATPVVIWGGRTLYTGLDRKWMYLCTRRSFQYYEKSIVDSTRWAVHRPNDYRLWRSLENRVDEWLEGLMTLGAFPTDVKSEAFYVKSGIDTGVMSELDRDEGRVITEIGIAGQKPAEFVVFRFTQYEAGADVFETV
jgi:phage tail sheath protein FI